MDKFFTGLGDNGYTNLIRSGRIKKDAKIINAIGDVDELNSAIGLAISNITTDRIAKQLRSIQNTLFVIGSELASINSEIKPKRLVGDNDIKELEKYIEELGSAVKLEGFVLPGGSISASYLHLARAICRRAERSIIALGSLEKRKSVISYMNRLSSYLFVAALYMNRLEGVDESHPTY